MIKLLLIGSGSVHTYNYFNLVKDYFDEVRVVTDRIHSGYEKYGFVKGDFTIKDPAKALKNIRFIKDQISQFKPDIIHVQQANSTAFLTIRANAKFKIPLVLTAWGSDILMLSERHFLIRKMAGYNLSHADYLTADAAFVGDKMVDIVPETKNKILIANFGIEPFYQPAAKENIIYSNRLHKELYRIDKVIMGFARFVEKAHDNWKLVIAADGDKTGDLKKLTSDLKLNDRVEFIGWVEKAKNQEMYSRAKIFVSVPRSDATAISLLEAMHAGCIPVVSDLPAAREWINDGENGVIVNSFDEDFFARALTLSYEKLVAKNKSIIDKKGLKSINREKFINLYDKLLH
ncbi:MAG: glycosyltransferase family 4 protein [Bacteroidales bacterium]|nr:glycosyltransferase family 4 protein [Bacteroidales bacterium]